MLHVPPDIDIGKLSPDSKELFMCISKYFNFLMTEKEKKINKLEKTVNQLNAAKVLDMEDEMDSAAAYSRKESLIIAGSIPEGHRNENCNEIVVNLLKNNINLHVDSRDISIAHCVGVRKQQSSDRKNIIFKLCRRDLKHDILSACR